MKKELGVHYVLTIIFLKNGLCADESHCVEQNENGTCKRCLHDDYNSFCINHNFGYIDLFFDYCLECNDSSDLEKCTKCFEGYKINKNECEEIAENQLLRKV